jgi:predicted esterase
MRPILSLVVLLVAAATGFAQAERYELGQRLKAFEKQWDKTTDEKLKKKAAEGLPKLTGLYFTGQFGEAGRTLDEARWILEGKRPSDDEKWAESLYAVPDTRYATKQQEAMYITIKAFYPMKTARPKNLTVKISTSLPYPVEELPLKLGARIAEQGADHALRIQFWLGDEKVAQREIGISTEGWEDERPRKGKPAKLPKPEIGPVENAIAIEQSLKKGTLEWATAHDRAELFHSLIQGEVPETDIPAWKMHQQLMIISMMHADKKDFFTPDRPGEFWLSIPTGKTTTPARLYVPKPRPFVPEGEDDKKTLVVALHGAGGSENLFFEGYGDGQILKLCQKRGWMLVAPRIPLSLFGGGPPVGEIVDELAKRYSIDPNRVFIVGHSMGAMQAIDAVQKYPGKFAGLAAFGGDGRIRKSELFAELPTFIGVGDKDFTLKSVRALKKALADGGAKAVTYKEYDGLEHMLICREALPDAFAMFDKVNAKK